MASFSIIEENHVFINFKICEKLNVLQPKVFCCFLTDFDQGKKYALFCNSRIQHNISKHNLLGTVITLNSFLVSKQVVRCQRDD